MFSRTSRLKRSRRVLAALLAVLSASALVGACGSGTGAKAENTPAQGTPTAVPSGLEDFYGQSVNWYACDTGDDVEETKGGDFSCALVKVPLDYTDPSGQTIQIALKKRAADAGAIGTLFVNPGGPGGSGVELVDSVAGYFSADLTAAYDVIGFDPRGVGASTAVDCLTDAELDAQRSGADDAVEASTATEEMQEVAQAAEDMAAKCAANTKTAGLLDHIDTVSAARDLDILRAVTTDNQVLTYLGYSYGTYLGATYAQLFPTNVGRLVLDGAIDPTLSAGQLALGQAAGFENELRTFVDSCQDADACPLSGSVDAGVQQVRDFLEGLNTKPIQTSDASRPLTYSLALSAIIGALYQDESWSILIQGLNQAMLQDDGSMLLYIADLFASRNEDGTYSGNGDEVISAINCLDYPVTGDASTWEQEASELVQASGTFGQTLEYSDLYCQAWGHTSGQEKLEITAQGAAPILVVGTTGDPATPYQWAQALTQQLADARLLTWEGNGHTAYGRAGKCITNAVDAYLLNGTLPAEGKTCSGQS